MTNDTQIAKVLDGFRSYPKVDKERLAVHIFSVIRSD